jgi:hypothetical protein
MREQLAQRIAELKAERDARRTEAERLDYAYAAVIGELERLLAVLEPPPPAATLEDI